MGPAIVARAVEHLKNSHISQPQTGSNTAVFGLSRLQGRKYVHIMHGGLHSEYAIKVKHALEKHSISCFVDNCHEASRQQMQAASRESYVLSPLIYMRAPERG